MKESILIINNNSGREGRIKSYFIKQAYVIYHAEHGLKALRILNNNNISVILYELISEEQAEFGFLEYIRKKHPSIQVIIISKLDKLELALNAMKNGAYDYILDNIEMEELEETVKRAILEKRDIESNLSTEKKNREYQKILIKELEITRRELKTTKKLLEDRNLELELIYGHGYINEDENKQAQAINSVKKERIGKYTILEEIGKGGMSIVYKAIDHILNREVAIKELTISDRNFPAEVLEDVTKRFRKEAQVIAMLRHENIVKVFDIIQEKNKHYMVMEYIEGITLDKLIFNNKKLPVMEAVNIISEVCQALEYIHQNNIIHRDIKPSNIIISNDRTVKLMDFGVIRDKSSSTITPTGSIIGTLSYTAPEQSSKSMDFRVDIFSLGTIFYELLTGKNPFIGETYADIFLKISSLEPEAPSTINSEANKELDKIVLKAMEKDPENRYLNARELFNDLIKFSETYENFIA